MSRAGDWLRPAAEVLDVWRRGRTLDDAPPEREHREATGTIGLHAGLVEQVAGEAAALIAHRPPDQVIDRVGRAYLERWWIERSEGRAIYLHHWLGDDPDLGLHDHPADSASLCLAGALRERWLARGDLPDSQIRERFLAPGAVVYRRAAHAHQMYVESEEPLTLFVFGPRSASAEWGFWVPSPDGTRKVRYRHPSPPIHPPQE